MNWGTLEARAARWVDAVRFEVASLTHDRQYPDHDEEYPHYPLQEMRDGQYENPGHNTDNAHP